MTTATRIADLDLECYPNNPLTRTQLEKAILSANWVVCSSEDEGAYLILECTEAGVVIIRRLGVTKAERGKGKAKKLLGGLEGYECEAMVREDNYPALKLLCRVGFIVDSVVKGKFEDKDGVKLWRGRKLENTP